jgi:hypothetical protein
MAIDKLVDKFDDADTIAVALGNCVTFDIDVEKVWCGVHNMGDSTGNPYAFQLPGVTLSFSYQGRPIDLYGVREALVEDVLFKHIIKVESGATGVRNNAQLHFSTYDEGVKKGAIINTNDAIRRR